MSLPAPRADPDLVRALRADLAALDFTVDGLAAYLGPVASGALGREQPLPAERATRADAAPLAAAVRLFTLAVDVPAAAVDAAFPALGAAGLVALGLADRVGGDLRARCDLRPYADETHAWWVASDFSEVRGPLEPDHVLGIGGASLTLASWTPRPRVRRALDLGTGCGVQALHLTGHADRIVATDLSARALEFARFNAALAGVDWEQRRGDLLAPVAGERFDLVVSNPPYVITPRGGSAPVFEYRDGGRAGDGVVEAIVRGVGDVLAPGGIAHLIGNWEIGRGADWRDRWRTWLEGTGLDAWVIQRDVQDPAEYAETWARDGGHLPGTPAHDELYASWLDDFAERGVDGIGFGIVTLQRPETDREPFVDLVEVAGGVASPMGEHVLAGLRARTWIAENGPDAVLDVAWRAAGDVTVEQHFRPGASDPEAIVVRQGGGLRRAFRVDTVVAALLSVCEGELDARAALAAIAGILDVDAEAALESARPVLRDLVADGLLVR